MTDVKIVDCTGPAELYRHYDGQSAAQPVYIELDLRQELLLADYNSEIGNAVPFSVRHGLDRRYSIPVVTADAANRVMREIAPLAARILADWEEVWDGRNMVARLGTDAIAAEDEIEVMLGICHPYESPFGEGDLVGVWDIDSAVNGSEVEEYGITAETGDERLDEIEQEVLTDLADCGEGSVAVCHGLDTYLRGLRDELRQDAADNDAA
ncbi:hypothetical protein [Streptomyces sp. NPDC002215]|uniref:hypothetical protein n=1 Tax=Streptomyces sp. NPDC002215 TaxID=3154412 RepID=UPI00332B57FD